MIDFNLLLSARSTVLHLSIMARLCPYRKFYE